MVCRVRDRIRVSAKTTTLIQEFEYLNSTLKKSNEDGVKEAVFLVQQKTQSSRIWTMQTCSQSLFLGYGLTTLLWIKRAWNARLSSDA